MPPLPQRPRTRLPRAVAPAVLTLVAYWYENRDALTATPPNFDRLIQGYARVRL